MSQLEFSFDIPEDLSLALQSTMEIIEDAPPNVRMAALYDTIIDYNADNRTHVSLQVVEGWLNERTNNAKH